MNKNDISKTVTPIFPNKFEPNAGCDTNTLNTTKFP